MNKLLALALASRCHPYGEITQLGVIYNGKHTIGLRHGTTTNHHRHRSDTEEKSG